MLISKALARSDGLFGAAGLLYTCDFGVRYTLHYSFRSGRTLGLN